MVNLSVKIGKLKLKNPVMVGSGTFGAEYGELVDISKLGAYVAKTITLKPRTGNAPPRVAETASGMLNSIGLENKGVEYFIKEVLPAIKKFKVPIVASIAGDDEAEFAELAKRLDRAGGVAAIELNLSCPNLVHRSSFIVNRSGETGIIAQDEKAVYKIVKAVRKATKLTVITKLSPNVTDITKIAKTAEGAGADALTVANTFVGMALDIDTKKPKIGNVTGGLSGPAIKPLSLRLAWQARNAVKIPIIGSGGIMDWKDAVEFILCGASAVQVGTANFVNPSTATEIISGIKGYLAKNKIDSLKNLIGKIKI